MYVYAMLPLKGLLPLNVYSPQNAQLLLQFAPPFITHYSPFLSWYRQRSSLQPGYSRQRKIVACKIFAYTYKSLYASQLIEEKQGDLILRKMCESNMLCIQDIYHSSPKYNGIWQSKWQRFLNEFKPISPFVMRKARI